MRERDGGFSDGGFSMAELLVVLGLMAVAAAVFSSLLVSAQRTVGTEQTWSTDNDRARLAVERLDREVRSGNILYDPAAEFDPNFSLRVYTQSNQLPRCVQWRIYSGQLQRRSWVPPTPPTTLEWTIVTAGVVNRSLAVPVPAFKLDPDPKKSGRTLIVDILTSAKTTGRELARVEASITGRNTTFGYPTTACEVTPAP